MKKFLSVILLAFSISAVAQNNLPDPPEFLSASVIPESTPTTVKLTWNPSDSTDVEGYIIYKIVDNITTTLDTVYGRLTTSYDYSGSSANSTSERFRLASFDTDGYKSTITDPHSTILLKSSFDKCEHKTTLTWSNYTGWGTNIANYRVYRRFTGTEYQLIKTLTATTNEYTDENLANGRWYSYYIEAVKNNGTTATSNSIEFTASGHQGPLYIKANYASVDENQNITLNFQIANSGQVTEYQLLRSINGSENFNTIASFPYSGQTQIVHTDSDVDASQNLYQYKLVSIDPCGQISGTSNIASNILLTANSSDATEHDLSWTEYKEWPNGVISYKIYSYFDGVATEIGSNGQGALNFSNNISEYVKRCHDKGIYLTSSFCYFIEAYENTPDVSQQNVSRSNIACIYETPIVWMPTAFNITSKDEINRTFKPVLSFVKDYPYEFLIYDRWGQLVFKTTNVSEGWSGKDAKKYYHTDYYVYKIRYADYKDKEYSKTGTFYLLME
ncbi:MAG: gliding motility-associated C-terminal domain-containing protein [Bacteroidales bacterium]|jgi:gliding motility-associated-like protein|nr:gliding motility-associated C-terminal domain-containing protein [Bacteroidales bacterium]